MILRFRGPDGMLRLEVNPSDTFASVRQKLLSQLPSSVDPESIIVSSSPSHNDAQQLDNILNVTIATPGLKHGDIVFLLYKPLPSTGIIKKTPSSVDNHHGASALTVPEGVVGESNQSSLDDYLDSVSGKIRRDVDHKMCRHGVNGMCDHCLPLDPFDAGYLRSKNIKYLSFHSHLRKKKTLAANKSDTPAANSYLLTEPSFTVKQNCPSGHPPWPRGICTKCQPGSVILNPQPFRMVDHVEFASPVIINTFLDAWRRTGSQRLGYLYGRYDHYSEVPLGVKAVVEAIYEPPQLNELDGVLLEPFDGATPDIVARSCGMERIGIIWTDLVDMHKGDGSVLCKRHADSYFLASQEICFAAHMQSAHPKPTRWSSTGYFGSNFVTCVVTGNEASEIEVFAYQVSNDTVAMTRANLIEPSADPTIMLVQTNDNTGDANTGPDSPPTIDRYIPEVFYRRINEHGASVLEQASSGFPVEFLFVTLTHGFPENPSPKFKDEGFPIENRANMGEIQAPKAAQKIIETTTDMIHVSNFHLLCYIHSLGALSSEEFELMCKVALMRDLGDAFKLRATPGWQTLLLILMS